MDRRAIRGRRAGLVLAGVVMALFAGTAQANTVTVGSSLTAPGFALVPFGSPATVTNYALPGPATAISPVDGTIVSWRFIGAGGPLTPRVLRSTAGTTLTGAGTGTPQNAIGPGVISGPFPLNLPIKRGEFFGVDGAAPSGLSIAQTAAASNLYFEPALVDGGAGRAPLGTNPGEDAVGATVRFCLVPNLKRKTRKAAREALIAADCVPGLVRKSKKRRRAKRVLGQSIPAGSSIPDTQPVDFKISRKRRP